MLRIVSILRTEEPRARRESKAVARIEIRRTPPGAVDRVADAHPGNRADRVRYGYRMLRVLLNREGWKVGKELVYRLYKEEGLGLRNQVLQFCRTLTLQSVQRYRGPSSTNRYI
jgi:hypothetical protein